MILRVASSALILNLAPPAFALDDPPAHSAPAASSSPVVGGEAAKKGVPNFDAMISVVDKMFPPQPDPSPERLALARSSVQMMWPDGSYAKMMTGFIGNIFTGMMQIKKSDLASIGGTGAKVSANAPADSQTLHDKAAAKDPYFDKRMLAMRAVIEEEIGKLSVIIDPRIREGLARSMARRFDARQLNDINRFFATPSGRALASEYSQLWFEPDMLRAMTSAFPEMMKLMPDAMQKLKGANDKFPKPPGSASATKH